MTASIVILLMLAGLRLAQTDSETMDREGFHMGERVTFTSEEKVPGPHKYFHLVTSRAIV